MAITIISNPMLSGGNFGIEGSVFNLGEQTVCLLFQFLNHASRKEFFDYIKIDHQFLVSVSRNNRNNYPQTLVPSVQF